MKTVFTQVILPGFLMAAGAYLIYLDVKIDAYTAQRIMPEYYKTHQAYEGVHE